MPQTGATRYQKFLKSEKAKTKLKAKTDLPKGTNVTKTNFKVKKIVIKEQLKKHAVNEVLSTRKLNIKELLSRLNHFNIHSRTDALNGLKELITTNSNVLEYNLGQLVHGVTPLLLNIEKVIRHESLKVLHLMLSNVPTEKIEPFFDFLCTYLRSTMTHIDSRIQEDSILFLDVLLACTPSRIAKDFHKIIPNFLDMISKLRMDSKPGRMLTVNLDSQLTSVKWRVKVLHRLQDFLNKYIEYNNLSISKQETTCESVKFDENQYNNYPLFNMFSITAGDLPCFSAKNYQDTQELQDEVEKFKLYIETLMPLLFETWLEVCPNTSKQKNIETVLNEDAAGLLKHTLEVISLIWKLMKKIDKNPSSTLDNFFVQKYRQPFSQHIFRSFPYVTNIRNRTKTTLTSSVFENLVTDPKLVIQNLEICYLFILFNPIVNIKTQMSEINSLLMYVERSFSKDCEEVISDIIIKILNTIFCNESSIWIKDHTITNSLFIKIINSYFNQALSSNFRQKIFALLCQIGLNNKLVHFQSSKDYKNWLKSLPDILLEKTVTAATVDVIFLFATRNNKIFNDIIKPNLLNIIENLPNITVTGPKSSMYKLFSMLYWIKCWNNESLNLLEKQLLNNVYGSEYGKYIFDTLRLRSTIE